MGSARYVTCCVALGRITRNIFVFAGTVAAFGDASVAVVNHVTFVCDDHHRVILRSEGPDQRVHIVLYPPRQVVPNDRGYGGDGGVEIEVGVGIQEMAEDTGESALEQAATPLFLRASSDRASRRVTTSVKKRR